MSTPKGAPSAAPLPAAGWSDEAILAVLEEPQPREHEPRLHDLLDRRLQGELPPAEAAELDALLNESTPRLLRRAAALREAVRRGLAAPATARDRLLMSAGAWADAGPDLEETISELRRWRRSRRDEAEL